MDVSVGLWRRLSTEELMLLNCGVGEDSWESLGDSSSLHPVHSEDQPWDFFLRSDAKAETPVLWPPLVKSWLIAKDSDAGRDWGQEEKGTTEDEMAGWHHWLDGCESQWTPGVADGQGGLACYDSWGCKELDTTVRLHWMNWTTFIRAPIVGQLVKNLPAVPETWVQSLGWKNPRRKEKLFTPVFWSGQLDGLLELDME